MAIEVGGLLDRRWTLRSMVARAEHATLYQAAHAFLDREASVVVGRPEDREAVLREAKLRDETFHPGVLGVLDVGDTPGGTPYIVSAPLGGRPLDGLLLTRGALPPEEALRIAEAIGAALSHIHGRGLAHAALSPSGVMVERDRALLLDLGVFPTPLSSLVGPLASLPYSAPERLREGAPASAKTDVYSLAAMLAEMLTGDPPSEWSRREGTFHARIERVVDRGLAPAEERFDTVQDLLDGLTEASSIQPIPPSLPPPSKREKPRSAYVTAARVRRPHGDALDGRTENVSEGGLLILCNKAVDVGESVLVRFALPVSGTIVSEPATVRWVRGGEEKAAFGVSFDDPTAATLEDIRHYVDLMGVLDGP